MSSAPAVALLVLVVACGGDEAREPATSPPETTARSVETPAPDTTPVPQPTAPPATESQPAPSPAPWRDCGRIRSPLDRRPKRVEARVFDCRAARRVAVRYLRDRSLPEGWTPADCTASRAACEQGGWGFRIVER